jgi:hypothetical protein
MSLDIFLLAAAIMRILLFWDAVMEKTLSYCFLIKSLSYYCYNILCSLVAHVGIFYLYILNILDYLVMLFLYM